jgi:hypothetical protein
MGLNPLQLKTQSLRFLTQLPRKNGPLLKSSNEKLYKLQQDVFITERSQMYIPISK